MSNHLLLLVADAILILHVAFVAFVVLGLVGIYLGSLFGWRWVRHFWLRVTHLGGIVIVAAQSWFGIVCPLTIWEMALRERAGGEFYSGSFIQHWLQNILYYSAPEWVFIVAYTLFGGLVLASWFIVRPTKNKRL